MPVELGCGLVGGFGGGDDALLVGLLRGEEGLKIGEAGARGEDRHEGAVGSQSGEADPGGDGCAAPGGVDEADGDVLAGVDLAAEEEGNGREVGGGGGVARGPGGGLVVEGIVVGLFVEDEETELTTKSGIGGGGNFFVGVFDDGGVGEAAEGHLHVGLAGGEPDIADEDVGESDLRAAVDGEGVGPAGSFGCEVDGEGAEVVGVV